MMWRVWFYGMHGVIAALRYPDVITASLAGAAAFPGVRLEISVSNLDVTTPYALQ